MDVSAGVSSSAVEKNIVIVLDVNISIVNYEVVWETSQRSAASKSNFVLKKSINNKK